MGIYIESLVDNQFGLSLKRTIRNYAWRMKCSFHYLSVELETM